MAWLTGARLDRARELLETTSQPVEHIGRFTGLGAPAGVRAAFASNYPRFRRRGPW